MPFGHRDLHLFLEWTPMRHYFHPEHDRLELITSDDEKLMLQWSSSDPEHGMIVLDPEYLPAPFTEIPLRVREYAGIVAFDDDQPWWVAPYDGTLTVNGPTIEFRAFGPGWTWKVHTRLSIKSIISIQRAHMNTDTLARSLGGVYMSPNSLQVHRSEVHS